jgi:hypothetical protein
VPQFYRGDQKPLEEKRPPPQKEKAIFLKKLWILSFLSFLESLLIEDDYAFFKKILRF